jgi:6-phosphogluconolactonase (cycloisomerase 2 family)
MNNNPVLTRMLVVLGIVSLLSLAGCGSGTTQSPNIQPTPPGGSNPTPTITTISPNTAAAGGAAFTLTITGTNFVAASMVNFGGASPATTFVNSTQLTAAIPAAAIASTGTPAVTVTNPAPGGTSNAVNFTITSGSGTNPVPAINALDPSCAPVVGQAITLDVFGSNFVASSVVRWNGSDRPTAVGSTDGTALTAQIPASDVAASGTAAVTVFNPAPGGGSSNTSTFTITTGGVGPQSIAVDSTGKFAYVANTGCPSAFDGNVSMYTIDATTGVLASIGPPVDSNDEGGRAVTVDPSGKFAYVANWGEGDTAGSVSMYTINATTGALTSTGMINGMCPGLCAPWSVAVDPSGKFVYVANEGGFAPTSISMFTINTTTGALTSIGTIAAGGRAISVTVDPTGKFAYVVDVSHGFPGENDNVAMYNINATTGALMFMGTIAAGLSPSAIAIDQSGKFAYVTNSGSNDVSMYTINTNTGALTFMGTTAAGSSPTSIAIASDKFAYVTSSGSNDVSMYSLNAAGGLTFMGTIAAGSSPSSIAIDKSGKFAYVTNSGSNNVSMYSIDAATGTLALIGTIGT